MGRCHDFGVQVGRDCEHPMQAGDNACSCPHCDSVCEGQFNGCAGVWARGPRAVQVGSPALAEDLVGNGQPDRPDTVSTAGGAGGGMEARDDASEAHLDVLAWPEKPIHALRTQLEALSRAMAHQQGVVTQLVNGYSDVRRASESESLLLVVRTVLEDGLARLEAALRQEMARDSGRLNELAGELQELTADQRAHRERTATAGDELRDALYEEKTSLSEGFVATAGAIADAVGQVREFATDLSAATIRESREARTHASGHFSELKEAILELRAAVERHDDRQVIGQWLYAMADSIGRVVPEAVTQAVGESEERMLDHLEKVVERFQHSLAHAEEVSARDRITAERAQAERDRELHASLAELSDALRGTHALAAAQREETELLDSAMRTLQESFVDVRESVERQHVEIREDMARQQRSSRELVKRQLRPVTESLPGLVAAAAQAREEEVLRRVEKAVAKLGRSLERAQEPRSRAHE